ncbi:MAG TPA: sigma-54 dependent transcriptional regulator [Accumulibacter sp.]|uniref:sigma-54-dependent transcriptional regulator n=1 Tax=Accumulibacter sp. TaxID=2053492 RepID=UPI002607543B|nr:sigma-54 dependent transcriptional regulator [Accumulibacter sp.]MDS4054853.1 sigma-54 dependent transcriptional regulator [Accumulibacter sp.]HMV04586.1 sigma-54 dependent transcriptional regulator [Accumulibacter sp.]HMW63238.1 sigma-54 dependent transcriptional regulator [Accumulibacter sp.]HMW79957.1 sigma-54 dependent transcriptional regulator [Accumulibacter sp.]HMX69292.1 sigma-54 dependent transcriptional regulator [Accumulibacter sp.]
MSIGRTERRPRGELARVLVVDDEEDIRELLDLTVARMGLSADCAGSVNEAKRLLEQQRYKLCITDMRLPDGDGLEIVRLISERYGQTPVAVLTAHGSAQNAVAALKAGAFDYVAKPMALDQLRSLIRSALSLPSRNWAGEASHTGGHAVEQLIGQSAAIEHVRQMIERLARSQAPVYISGESGTGKELAARLIHDRSARQTGPFIPVNCGAIPETLMESEFFGYRKGAFTGAESDRDGFFQAAKAGTLFLDEVADLPLPMQVKLLRAIQEKRVRKVGSAVEEAVDVRIISATHRTLKDCVDAGSFRQDLYYRLNVIELRMPPLRERQEDIAPLVDALLRRICAGKPPRMDVRAMQALQAYSFAGNVRELENILERAVALCTNDTVLVDDLGLVSEIAIGSSLGRTSETLDDYINRLERQAILDALSKTNFNRTAAARLLGVSFRSLRYRIDRLGIEE